MGGGTMTEDESRKQFEQWVSGPPFEHCVKRYADDTYLAGQYVDIVVDFAWITWQEARKPVEAAQ
jgi:hypothetical protein